MKQTGRDHNLRFLDLDPEFGLDLDLDHYPDLDIYPGIDLQLHLDDHDLDRVVQHRNPELGLDSDLRIKLDGRRGGVPEFPYQRFIASIFTVLLAAFYLLVRQRKVPTGRSGPKR